MTNAMGKLGFGFFRLPLLDSGRQGDVDVRQVCEMADIFLERGFSYFDTAYSYHDGQSEAVFRKTVVERYDRNRFSLADKMPVWLLKEKEDQERIFHEQLGKCGVEYFDYYLLHALNRGSFETAEQLNTFEYLAKEKERGSIKSLGFSFHDSVDVLERILEKHPEVDFVQLQINYYDWEDERIQSRKCYRIAEKYGKPVMVMEPVKGGRLARLPAEAAALLTTFHPDWSLASWAIRFAAGLSNVHTVLSGMSNVEQVLDNTSFMQNFSSLGEEEQTVLQKVAEIYGAYPAIQCTGCRYCEKGCPADIPIPDCFAQYNTDKLARRKGLSPEYEAYMALVKGRGKASACIQCGQCEEICPQHLPVTQWIRKTARLYEKIG